MSKFKGTVKKGVLVFILLNSKHEIEKIRAAGKLAAELLNYMETLVVPGISTEYLNEKAEEWTQAKGAWSGPLGYNGYTKSICTSVNDVICHGIPNKDHILNEGDIVNIDVSPVVDGFYGDTSRTFPVGKISDEAQRLIDIDYECLELGIAAALPGNRIGAIGEAIQTHAEDNGYSVVREFVGHGIGRYFHMPPEIPHFGKRTEGLQLRPGMIFTIEPMINIGEKEAVLMDDKWTAKTVDGSLSAQAEHMVLITDDGNEVLTRL